MDIEIPQIKLGEIIGEGAFGTVYKGYHKTLGIDVAIKIVDKYKVPNLAIKLALKEARLFARLDHPNLLRIYDAQELEKVFYLILEYMDGGSLESHNSISSKQINEIAIQLLSGLQALHDAGILHRDIKPANCLMRKGDNRVKLADLGIAAEIEIDKTALQQFTGTLSYMSPEILEEPPEYSIESDLYALGMTLARILLNKEHFPKLSRIKIIKWIQNGKRPIVKQIRDDISSGFSDLISSMIDPDINNRPNSTAQCLVQLINEPMLANKKCYPGTVNQLPITGKKTNNRNLHEGVIIGSWLLTTEVFVSENWHSFIVTHTETGAPGHLSLMQHNSQLKMNIILIKRSLKHSIYFNHSNLSRILDWGDIDDNIYIVTAGKGQRIIEIINKEGTFNELDAINFTLNISKALVYLHERSYVYQAVSPTSVQLTKDGKDVQLAWPLYCIKTNEVDEASNNNNRVYITKYAAPESLRADGMINTKADIYGIGQILYYLLAGFSPRVDVNTMSNPPYPLKNHDLIFHPIKKIFPHITQPTNLLLQDILHPNPSNRPDTALEVHDALSNIATGLVG